MLTDEISDKKEPCAKPEHCGRHFDHSLAYIVSVRKGRYSWGFSGARSW